EHALDHLAQSFLTCYRLDFGVVAHQANQQLGSRGQTGLGFLNKSSKAFHLFVWYFSHDMRCLSEKCLFRYTFLLKLSCLGNQVKKYRPPVENRWATSGI